MFWEFKLKYELQLRYRYMGVAILGVMMVKGGALWVYPRHL